LFMMVGSNHDVTYWNENIFIISPALLVVSYWALLMSFGNTKALRRFRKANTVMAIGVLIFLVLKLVLFDFLLQANWNIIVVSLSLYGANSTIPFEKIGLRKRRIIDDSDW